MSEKHDFPKYLAKLFHVLSSPRRCYVIKILADNPEDTVSVRYLSRQIAAIEEEIPPDRATGEPYRNVYNALTQTHLSTLSNTDIIVHDSDRQTATAGSNLEIAALLIVLNQATYQTFLGDSIPGIEDMDTASITD